MADMLATVDDLALLPGMAGLDDSSATVLLEAATAAVQAIVGQRLVQVAGDEVTLFADGGLWLDLPERPVTAVTSVTVGGTAVTDYTVVNSRLWRWCGWLALPVRHWGQPSPVTVVYDHGLAPDDYRAQLARSAVLMLAAGAATTSPGVTSESIDDYQVVYDKVAGRMEASDILTRQLRATYGRPVTTSRFR